MKFGMVNSGATLVRGLKNVLGELSGVGSYIYDIVAYNDSWEEHLRTLKEMFSRLRKARIKKQVSSFQAIVSYYKTTSQHLPRSQRHCPTCSMKGKSEQVQWNEAQERAYSLLKEYLLQEPLLKLPDLMKPFNPKTDASEVRVAAVLLQENEGKLYPVS